MPDEPTRSGYTFNGWYTTSAATGGSEFTYSTTVTANITVYARWTASQVSQYTVTFNANGGNPTTAQTRMVVSGGTVGYGNMPTEPTRSGYTFNGWYTSMTSGSEFTYSTIVTSNITVYARWISGGSSISDITYSTVSGSSTWTPLSDGRRQSPAIGNSGITKSRVSFTSTANASITIQLDVSSEPNYDYAFISTLDNSSATSSGGYYPGSQISGSQTVTVTIPVSSAGSHFIDIGYQKDSSQADGSDCAWFRVVQ
jgi:uncharacterized repeat protein (TIGR02543 family)